MPEPREPRKPATLGEMIVTATIRAEDWDKLSEAQMEAIAEDFEDQVRLTVPAYIKDKYGLTVTVAIR